MTGTSPPKRKLPPRFFTASSRNVPTERTHAALEHVVDAFRFEPDEGGARDIVVAVDAEGALVALDADELEVLPPVLAAQVRFQEVRLGALRRIRARAIHLLDVELVEPGPDVPGVNDPVHLHGKLYGPIHARGIASTSALAGVLTVTRADILEAFVTGYPRALVCGGDGETGRVLHLLLPGDRPDQIEAGFGLVLAYPLLPNELLREHAANDALVVHTIHALLVAIERELGIAAPTVPVPSRRTLERALRAEGFLIDGDVASRPRDGIFGALFRERVALPPQGTVEDFVRAAARIVLHCERHPSGSTRALAERSRDVDRAPPPPPPKAPPAFVTDPRASRAPKTFTLPAEDTKQRRLRHERAWDELVFRGQGSSSGSAPTIAELIAAAAKIAADDQD